MPPFLFDTLLLVFPRIACLPPHDTQHSWHRNRGFVLKSTYSIDADKGFATVRVKGLVSPKALTESFDSLFRDPDWLRAYDLLLVYEDGALLGDLTLDDLKAIHAYTHARAKGAKLGRVLKSALVYSRREHKTLLELHRLAELDNEFIEENVFDTEQAAIDWLRENRPR